MHINLHQLPTKSKRFPEGWADSGIMKIAGIPGSKDIKNKKSGIDIKYI